MCSEDWHLEHRFVQTEKRFESNIIHTYTTRERQENNKTEKNNENNENSESQNKNNKTTTMMIQALFSPSTKLLLLLLVIGGGLLVLGDCTSSTHPPRQQQQQQFVFSSSSSSSSYFSSFLLQEEDAKAAAAATVIATTTTRPRTTTTTTTTATTSARPHNHDSSLSLSSLSSSLSWMDRALGSSHREPQELLLSTAHRTTIATSSFEEECDLPEPVVIRYNFDSSDSTFPFKGTSQTLASYIGFAYAKGQGPNSSSSSSIRFCDHNAIYFAILDVSDLTVLADFDTESESFVAEFIGDNLGNESGGNGENTTTPITILNATNTSTPQCGSGSLPPTVQLPIPLQLQRSNGNNNNTNNNTTMSTPNLDNYLQVKLTTTSNVDDLNCSPSSHVRFDVTVGWVRATPAPSTLPSLSPSAIPSFTPSISLHPTSSPVPTPLESNVPSQGPTTTCRQVPPVSLLFQFDSTNGTFPFGFSISLRHVLSTPNDEAGLALNCQAKITHISNLTYSGDFGSDADYFLLQWIQDPIASTGAVLLAKGPPSSNSTNGCVQNQTLAPNPGLTLPLSLQSNVLELALRTSSGVGFCAPINLVTVTLTIGYDDATSIPQLPSPSPSASPSRIPLISSFPTQSPIPSTLPSLAPSQAPSGLCEQLPPIQVSYLFQSGYTNTSNFPLFGGTERVTQDISTPYWCDAIVTSVSNAGYSGNFALIEEAFLLEFVFPDTNRRVAIAKSAGIVNVDCVYNETSPVYLTAPLALEPFQESLAVELTTTSSVEYYWCTSKSFVSLNVTLAYTTRAPTPSQQPSMPPSTGPSATPSVSSAPTEIPSVMPTTRPTRSAFPSQSVAPTQRPSSLPSTEPTYHCQQLPQVELDFNFSSLAGTFPFQGGSVNLTQPLPPQQGGCHPTVVAISNLTYRGDLDLSSEWFVAEFVEGNDTTTILNTASLVSDQCVNNTHAPTLKLPFALVPPGSPAPSLVTVRLNTSNSVNDLGSCAPESFVRFTVSIAYLQGTGIASPQPSSTPTTLSWIPSQSYAPTSWIPSQSYAPTSTPRPTSLCVSSRPVILNYRFNSDNGTFPFKGTTWTLTKALGPYIQDICTPQVVAISNFSINGDFDLSTESFVVRFVGDTSATILDTSRVTSFQCTVHTLKPSLDEEELPLLLAAKQSVLDVQLSTTARVDDFCASSFVEFDVTVDFVALTEPPSISPAPTQRPSRSANPSTSPRPTRIRSEPPSQQPSTRCDQQPEVTLQYRFDSTNATFPFLGTTETLVQEIPSLADLGCDAIISAVSNVSYSGDFGFALDYFLLQFVGNPSLVIVKAPTHVVPVSCVTNQTRPGSISTPILLGPSQETLGVALSTTATVGKICFPATFVALDVTIAYREQSNATSPQDPPSHSPTQTPSTSVAPSIELSQWPSPNPSVSQAPSSTCEGLPARHVSFDFSTFGNFHVITKGISNPLWCAPVITSISNVGYIGNFGLPEHAFALQLVLEDTKMLIAKSPGIPGIECVYNLTAPTYVTLPVYLEPFQDSLAVELTTSPFFFPSTPCGHSLVSVNMTIEYTTRSPVPSQLPSTIPSQIPSQIPSFSLEPSEFPSEDPTHSPSISWRPTISNAPTWTPSLLPSHKPSSTCAGVPPPVMLDFHFSSEDGTFPFLRASYTLTKPLLYDESCVYAKIEAISDVEVIGDLNSPLLWSSREVRLVKLLTHYPTPGWTNV